MLRTTVLLTLRLNTAEGDVTAATARLENDPRVRITNMKPKL